MNDKEKKTSPEKGKELPYRYFEQSSSAKYHHFYLSEEIGEPRLYTEMIHMIKYAPSSDTVYIYLNTPGGTLATGIQIIEAMRMSQANIVTVAEGQVCSLGALIFLNGKEMVMGENSQIMIHDHSGGAFGKGHEYLAQASAISRWHEKLARNTYTGFLTEEEFERMLKGEEFWMESEEVQERLVKYVEYLEKNKPEENPDEEEKN
jgi:ATP-dependent protease ClpP protease subunit